MAGKKVDKSKVILQQIEKICHQFRLLPYPFFYSAQRFMILLDLQIKTPGAAKFKMVPQLYHQIKMFNMKDHNIQQLQGQVAFVMIEEDRFPTEYSLFKVLSQVSKLEKDIENSDLSTLIRYMLVMDVIKSYMKKDIQFIEYLSHQQSAHLWKPYQKIWTYLTSIQDKIERDQIRKKMEQELTNMRNIFLPNNNPNNRIDPLQNQGLDQEEHKRDPIFHITKLPRLRLRLLNLVQEEQEQLQQSQQLQHQNNFYNPYSQIQNHQTIHQQYYRQFPLDIILVGDDRTLHLFTNQFHEFCKKRSSKSKANGNNIIGASMSANSRIFLIPSGSNTLAQYLATYDPQYLMQVYLPFRRNPFLQLFVPERTGASGGYSEFPQKMRQQPKIKNSVANNNQIGHKSNHPIHLNLFDHDAQIPQHPISGATSAIGYSSRRDHNIQPLQSPRTMISHKRNSPRSQATFSQFRNPAKNQANLSQKLIYLAPGKDQLNGVAAGGRRKKITDNLIPPISALDQQIQIYLRDADSQLQVKVYRVDFYTHQNEKSPKISKFFFGRFEIGQPLEYDDINFSEQISKLSTGNDSSRQEDEYGIGTDDNILPPDQIKLRDLHKKDRDQNGIEVKLYMKRMDMMGERDKTYSAFDEEISFPDNREKRDQVKEADGNEVKEEIKIEIGDQYLNENQHHHPHHQRRKPDSVETKIHRLHLSNVPMESERGLTQANPISNWLELCYIDSKSAKNEAEFLISKRKLKVNKMQRRSTTVSAIYTQLHVSQLKIVFMDGDFGRRRPIPIYLDGVDYSNELHDIGCIRIKQQDRFRLNIKRFMKPEI